MSVRILSGSVFEESIGYARAVVDGDWIFVSGTTGFDYEARTIADDVIAQTRQCVANIRSAMEEGGFRLEDAVRVRYIYPDRDDFERCWPVLRESFGPAMPAATMISAGLADPRMKVEIEVTGRRNVEAHGPSTDDRALPLDSVVDGYCAAWNEPDPDLRATMLATVWVSDPG